MGRRHAMMGGTALDLDGDLDRRLRAQAALVRRQRANEARYQADPWAFLVEAVSTLDQASGTIRRFPAHPYLEELTREWQAHRLLAVPKSRRMLVTWLFVALHYWLARFHENQLVAFAARKRGLSEDEGSAELVSRAHFIHNHLPPDVARPAVDYKTGRLAFPGRNSSIVGVGEGPDQLRQYTLSAVFADEFAAWERPLPTYIALRPTIEGGGRITIVSSANPGCFKLLVHDEL